MPTETALVPDYSYISTFARCPRRGYYAHVLGLEPPEPNIPALAGTAMHAALHVLYTQAWDYDAAREALAASWGDLKPSGRYEWLTLGHLEIVLRNYMEDRRPDEVGQVVEIGTTLDENAVVFDWKNAKGESIRLGGKIDLPRLIANQRYVIDHKTTTSWLNEWWLKERYPLLHQARIYVAALQALTGERYEGAYINGIYIGQFAADEPAAWAKRKSVRSKLFGPFMFSQSQLEETWEWAKTWLDTIRFWQEADRWPQNEGACSDFGGCSYLELCQAHPVVRPSLISRKYVRRAPTGVLASGADGRRSK